MVDLNGGGGRERFAKLNIGYITLLLSIGPDCVKFVTLVLGFRSSTHSEKWTFGTNLDLLVRTVQRCSEYLTISLVLL